MHTLLGTSIHRLVALSLALASLAGPASAWASEPVKSSADAPSKNAGASSSPLRTSGTRRPNTATTARKIERQQQLFKKHSELSEAYLTLGEPYNEKLEDARSRPGNYWTLDGESLKFNRPGVRHYFKAQKAARRLAVLNGKEAYSSPVEWDARNSLSSMRPMNTVVPLSQGVTLAVFTGLDCVSDVSVPMFSAMGLSVAGGLAILLRSAHAYGYAAAADVIRAGKGSGASL